MACLITFDNAPSTGVISGAASNSGVWEYIGYSTTEGGSYGAGGNFPSVTTWGQSIDTSNIVTGFYKFRYKANVAQSDPCYDEADFIIPIVQGTTDIPTNVVIDVCSNDAIRNIFNDSGIYDKASINGVITQLVGGGISSPGYSNGGTSMSTNITDDTYDPSQESSYPQTIVFQINYAPITPSGYSLSGCDNCLSDNMTVTYNVTETFAPGNPSNIATCNDGDI